MINTWYQALKCYHNRCYQCIVEIEPHRVLFPYYELLLAGSMLAPPCAMRKARARACSPSALKGTCVGGLPAFGLVVGPYGSWWSCGLGAADAVSPRARRAAHCVRLYAPSAPAVWTLLPILFEDECYY